MKFTNIEKTDNIMKNTPDEIIEVVSAFKAGKQIECCDIYCGENWLKVEDPNWNFGVNRYRIAPEPKLRPWKPEEVPLGLWIKSRVASELFLVHIDRVTTDGIRQSGNDYIHSFQYAFDSWVHSTDGGKTWKPCGVEE